MTTPHRKALGRPKSDRADYEPVPESARARKTLAERAQKRRKQIGLSLAEVSGRIGVARSTLGEWETCLPAHLLPEQARSWETALSAPAGWLTSRRIDAPLAEGETYRITLGLRARKRREHLGLTQKYLQECLNASLLTFRRWESALPRRMRPDDQHQWEAALQVPRGWLYDPSMNAGGVLDAPGASQAAVYRTLHKTAEMRKGLGFRAAERRTIIGLSLREIGAMTGLKAQALTRYEQEMPERLLEEQAAKWEDALEAPRGWLSDLSVLAPPPVALQSDLPEFKTVFDAIQGVASWLVRPRLRERCFHYSALNPDEQRRVGILLRRYGIPSGRPGIDAAAVELGAPRHEVAQIASAMADRSQGLDGKRLGPLDEMPRLVASLLPATTDALETKLSGMLGGVSIENADLFCKSLLGRSFFRDTKHRPLADASPKVSIGESTRLVRVMSAHLMRGTGAVQIHTLYGLVANASGAPILPADVSRLAADLPGFEWLDETTGWFWLEPYPSSRVNTIAIKILAACGNDADTKDITQGLARSDWQLKDENAVFHAFTPPEAVVAAILDRLPGIRINRKRHVELRVPVSPTECLSGSELAILRCVQAHGGVASWTQIKSDLVDSAVISLPSLNLALTNSPIVRKIDNALYAIRGMRFGSHAMEEALAGGKRRK